MKKLIKIAIVGTGHIAEQFHLPAWIKNKNTEVVAICDTNIKKLNTAWEIDKITGLTPEAEKARDYLMKLPDRMYRITERIVVPDTKFEFKWMIPS